MDNKYYVYKYYIDEQLIYVGRTNNFVERFKQHLRENSYYDKVNKIDIATFNSDGDMMLYEKYYITKFHPLLNKVDMQFSSPSFELPEPHWTSYSREEFDKLTAPKKEKTAVKVKQITSNLNNIITISGNVPLSWFKQFDLNTHIFNYNQIYTLQFETHYDNASALERKKMYKWDKNDIMDYWCQIIDGTIDKIPCKQGYVYDIPWLSLTIKKNNYDIIYQSLSWIHVTLDKNHDFYHFGPYTRNKIIDENGIFHIEESISEYELLTK